MVGVVGARPLAMLVSGTQANRRKDTSDLGRLLAVDPVHTGSLGLTLHVKFQRGFMPVTSVVYI